MLAKGPLTIQNDLFRLIVLTVHVNAQWIPVYVFIQLLHSHKHWRQHECCWYLGACLAPGHLQQLSGVIAVCIYILTLFLDFGL